MPRHSRSTLTNQTVKQLLAQAVDERHMLGVFDRVLPPLASVPIRVLRCHARADKSRSSLKRKPRRVNYRVTVEVGGVPRHFRLLGTMPVGEEFLGDELLACCGRALGHATVSPFQELATFVPELHLGLQFFPVDVDLPQLLDVLWQDPASLVAPVLGSAIGDVHQRVVHYKPGRRAVLQYSVALRDGASGPAQRVIYGKVFADDRGALILRDMQAIWRDPARAGRLRLPEPLGYNARHGMLLMAEVLGTRDLNAWVKCLERGKPLPDSVTIDRLERCFRSAAAALAELHACQVDTSDVVTFESMLEQSLRDAIRSRRSHPELVEAIEPVFERLARLDIRDERLVPSHSAFRHTQLMGDESTLVVLDWDGVVMASPALDAATFISRLRHVPLMQPGQALELDRLAALFRREYLARSAGLDERHLAAYEALKLVDAALRTLRRGKSPDRVAAAVNHLLAEAVRLLDSHEGR